MNDILRDLPELPEENLEQDYYLMELRQQCADLEERVQEILNGLADSERCTLQSYIALRDELEFQSVKQALRFRKNALAQK